MNEGKKATPHLVQSAALGKAHERCGDRQAPFIVDITRITRTGNNGQGHEQGGDKIDDGGLYTVPGTRA